LYALQENNFSFQLETAFRFLDTIINFGFSNTTLNFLFHFLVATDLPKLMMCHTCQKIIPSVLKYLCFIKKYAFVIHMLS